MYVILIYDIKTDELNSGAKVLRNVFKICKKYLHHIQYSVFEGEVTKAQFIIMKAELAQFIRKECDSLLIFCQSSNKWITKEYLGLKEDKASNMI